MIFIGSNQITKIYLGGSDLEAAYIAETKVYPEGAHDYSKDYLTTVALGIGNISLSGSNTANTFSYSTDEGQTWSTPAQVNTVAVSNGDKVLWKGTPTYFHTTQGMGKFMATANFNVEGNAMSLLYGDSFVGQTDLTGKNYAFRALFVRNTNLISAENLSLPATTLASRCYNELFFGCRGLTTAPKLPATTLADYCYATMFYDCSSLTTAPELPATTLANNCYQEMFRGCSNMTKAPIISATTLAGYCFYNAFRGCSSMTEAPVLPATTMAPYAYCNMFYDCTSLLEGPELPATTLADNCYQYMHYNCTTMTKAATVLPATTLASACYNGMYRECTSLTTAPTLPATTLAANCYNGMFSGCTNLNSITCLATDISATSCTTNWTYGVAATGTFYKAAEMENWQNDSVNGIPQGWTVKNYGDYSTQYFTTVALSGGTIDFSGSSATNLLSYSTDEGSTWTTMTAQTVSVPVNEGDRVMWKGTPYTYMDAGIGRFTTATTANFNVEGNTMSLLYGDNFQEPYDLGGKGWAFYGLFSGNTHLISAGNLVLTAMPLVQSCYKYMFSECTSLTTAPELPSTTLADYCYDNMFSGCISLTAVNMWISGDLAPYCCCEMFRDCTSLTTPPLLTSDTLAPYCYADMFNGCSALTTIDLQFQTLDEGSCKGMFASCGSLTSVLELSAETLAPYCYYEMFYGCSSLDNITCLATDISATDCTTDWLIFAASTGTFYKAASMEDWTRDDSGIPQYWIVQDA